MPNQLRIKAPEICSPPLLHHQPIGLPSDIAPGDIPCSPPLGLPPLPGDVPVPGMGILLTDNCRPHGLFQFANSAVRQSES